jgi:hypothetical protein
MEPDSSEWAYTRMRRIVVALSLTSPTLAGTTAYFAGELARERSRSASPAHTVQVSPEKFSLPELPPSRPAANEKPGSGD